MEEIIEILKREIEQLERKIEILKQEQTEKEEELNQKNKFKVILESIINENPQNVCKLNIDEIEKNIQNKMTKDEKELIMFCQTIFNTGIFSLTKDQEQKLINYCINILNKINNQINQIEISIQQKIENSEELKRLKKVKQIKKEIATSPLSIEKINTMVDYIKEANLSSTEKIEILIELGKYIFRIQDDLVSLDQQEKNNENNTEEDQEQISENEVELTDEELIEVFDKYNLNYNELQRISKEELKKYGNLKKIESILKELKGLIINLHENSKNITKILINSSPDIVRTIKNNIQEDSTNELSKEEFIVILEEYMKNSNVFIKGNKQFVKKNRNIGTSGKESTISGQHDNYKKNREFFKSLNVDINQAILKCGSIFVMNNTTIRKKISSLDFYGIPSEIYLNTLSCLAAPEPLDCIDQFIELGCYNYLLQNFSRVKYRANDPIFYRIVQAKQKNLPIYRNVPNPVTKKGKYKLLGNIVYGNEKNEDNIGETNGPEKVGQCEYYEIFSNPIQARDNYGYYEYGISQNDNCGPLILVKDNFFIKSLEENFRIPDNELIYNIGGVIISRYKVLRTYETLISNKLAGTYESLMFAICRNSILTENQCKIIEKELSEKINFRIKRMGEK